MKLVLFCAAVAAAGAACGAAVAAAVPVPHEGQTTACNATAKDRRSVRQLGCEPTVSLPDLSLSGGVANGVVASGGTTVTSLNLTNAGSAAATIPTGTVVARLTFPSGYTIASFTDPSGYTCIASGQTTVECAADAAQTIAAGEPALQFTVWLTAPTLACGDEQQFAPLVWVVDSANAVAETNEANNTMTSDPLDVYRFC